MKVLEVENLIRNYRRSSLKKSEEDVKVLKGLNFAVEEGEFVGIMGKSGCGKTTLLKVLGMIDKQTGGTVRFMEEDVSEIYGDRLADVRRKQIGFIFQDFYLMDSLSVEENIMLPMILGREKESVMTKAAQEYAEKFLISHLVKKNPYELSGGEKQRVAICRALINDPDLVLADEPTGALDYNTSKEILKLIETVNQKYGNTIIMVTHNDAIKDMADRVVRLRDGMIRKNYRNEHKIPAAELEW